MSRTLKDKKEIYRNESELVHIKLKSRCLLADFLTSKNRDRQLTAMSVQSVAG